MGSLVGSAGEAGDGITDQLRTDEQEEQAHDHRVVTGHPAFETFQQLPRPVSERESKNDRRQHTGGCDEDEAE